MKTILFFIVFYSFNLYSNDKLPHTTLPEETQIEQTEENGQENREEVIQEKEELGEELEITDSSMGLEWKESYTEAVVEVLEHKDIQPLFEATIHHEDLKKLVAQTIMI